MYPPSPPPTSFLTRAITCTPSARKAIIGTFFFPVYNNDEDSNETGAPILRHKLFFHTDGNHDLGSTGVSVNLLASDSSPRFSGNIDGGDALSYFNDFYFPQNGPEGLDIQNAWNGDTSSATGMTFSFLEQNYTSPAAIQALAMC